VISESAARRFWPGENPLGKRVWFGGTPGRSPGLRRPLRSSGWSATSGMKRGLAGCHRPPGVLYVVLQFSYPDTMMMVKSRGPAAALIPSLRRAVASVDPSLPIYDVLTLDDRIGGALARPRFNAGLVGGFAGAALLIAALGVYGMLSYSVSSRLVRSACGSPWAPRPAGWSGSS
jgi:hypothetical protein